MDEINKRLGTWGRYQGYVFALLFIPSFLGGCHTLISSFTLASPENRCFIPGLDNWTDVSYGSPFDKNLSAYIYTEPETQAGKRAYCRYCPLDSNISARIECTQSASRPCDHGRIYDTSQYKSTLSMQFDMVCENAYLREALRSLFMLGVLTGAAVFGVVSDKIGRKPTFVLCSLSEVVIFNIVPLATNYYLYCVLQFIGAAAQYGTYLTGFIIAMEVIDGFPRTIAGVGIQAYFTIGYLYVGMVGYLIRDWQWLQFSVSILTLLYLPYYWLLPESIRWLLVNGKREQAQKTLDRACKINRVPQFAITHSEEAEKVDQSHKKKASLLDLFKNKRLACYTLVIFFTWLVCSLTYYGLSLNTADLPGDEYVNFILSGLFELPGLAASIPMMQKFGRKPTIIVLLTLSGVACLISGLLPVDIHAGIVASATIGKMCIAGAFAVIYVYSAEIYPTVVRNTGTGFSSLFARIGSICAPQIHLLAYYVAHWVPIVVYGGFALTAACTDFCLPETRGRKMPETLEDTLRLAKPASKKYTEEMRPATAVDKSPPDTARSNEST